MNQKQTLSTDYTLPDFNFQFGSGEPTKEQVKRFSDAISTIAKLQSITGESAETIFLEALELGLSIMEDEPDMLDSEKRYYPTIFMPANFANNGMQLVG